ncbi:hypothetical protein BGZ50_000261 [Haplosporangium sp. Z 11]|nr:hypothetical protein BGZ50_000261 [Haplosporangium sp. Z 11]
MDSQKDTDEQQHGIKSESTGSIHESDEAGARIEATEKLLAVDPSAKEKINPDQLSAVDRKVEATAPLKELQSLLDLMAAQDTKDQLAAKKSHEDRAHDLRLKAECVSQEQEEAVTLSFIQLIRFFYALKELDDAKDHLEGTLANSQAVLSVFRAQLFQTAQAAEMEEDKEHQAKLCAMVRKLAKASLDTVAEDGAVTFNDVHDEVDRITRPTSDYSAKGSEGAEEDSAMVISEPCPISENTSRDVIRNEPGIGPPSSASPPPMPQETYRATEDLRENSSKDSYPIPTQDCGLQSDAAKPQGTKNDADAPDTQAAKLLTSIPQGIEASSDQLLAPAAPTQQVQEYGYAAPWTEGVSGAPLAHPYPVHFGQQAHHLLRSQIQHKQPPPPGQVYYNEPSDSAQQLWIMNMQRIQQTATETHPSNASNHASEPDQLDRINVPTAKSHRRRPNRTHSRSPAKGSCINVVGCQGDTTVQDAGGPPRDSSNPFFSSTVTQSGQAELRSFQEQSRRVREPGQGRTRSQGLSPIEEEPPTISLPEHLPPMSLRQRQTTPLISSQSQNQIEQQREHAETNQAQDQLPEQLAAKGSAASDSQSHVHGQQPQISKQTPNRNQNRRSDRRQGTPAKSQSRSSSDDQVVQMHLDQPPFHAGQPFRQQYPVHPTAEPSVPVAFPMIHHPVQHPGHQHHQQLSQLQLGQHHGRVHVQPYGHQQQYYQYPHYYYPGFHLNYEGQMGGSPVPGGGGATGDVDYEVHDQGEFRMRVPVHEHDEYLQYRNAKE